MRLRRVLPKAPGAFLPAPSNPSEQQLHGMADAWVNLVGFVFFGQQPDAVPTIPLPAVQEAYLSTFLMANWPGLFEAERAWWAWLPESWRAVVEDYRQDPSRVDIDREIARELFDEDMTLALVEMVAFDAGSHQNRASQAQRISLADDASGADMKRHGNRLASPMRASTAPDTAGSFKTRPKTAL